MMRQIAFQAFFLIFQCFSSEVFTLFLRVETGHQNIAINGRDPYYGHFTKIYFHNLTCIYSIDIHCLKELTGAEEIDLLYSECRRGHWQVAHYTNSKHNFRLKEAIHAQRLLISSRSDLAIIDAQVDSCSSNISKPSIDCNRSSREHIHRHGKQGSILRAVDSTIIEHQRYKRDTSKPTTFHEISSGLHEINKDLIVERGSILTIKAGSHLKFNKNSGIIVLGILHINGTSLSPVIMESKNPEQYQWKGIIFNDAELNNIISNLNISGAEAGIKVERGPTPYLENVNLNRNGYGINIRHPSTFTYLTGIVSSNNEKNGIEYLGQKSISINNCIVSSNGGLGIFIKSDSKIIIRKSAFFSNNATGIYIGTSDVILENVIISSNGDIGLHAEIKQQIEIYNVNISAHFSNYAMEMFLLKNCECRISRSHFHDNKIGAIKFSGQFQQPQIKIVESNFVRNSGKIIDFERCQKSIFILEKSEFLANTFSKFNGKNAAIKISGIINNDDDENPQISIRSNKFEQNALYDVINFDDSSSVGAKIEIIENKFLGNLANSIITINGFNSNISLNRFENPKSKCQITFSKPKIPTKIDKEMNEFGANEALTDAICSGDYQRFNHSQSMNDQNPLETRKNHEDLMYLENPFKKDMKSVVLIKSSQTPYLIEDEIQIASGQVVTVESGTIFDFAPGVGVTIQENSRLILNGTDDRPIVLRGQNGNNWRGIVAKPKSQFEMTNGIIEEASIGLWIDSDHVRINGGRIIRPMVHGVEITHNSNNIVDLGGLIIEGATGDSSIGVDERSDDITIQNVAIRDSSGSGIGFVTPTGNIEINNVDVSNMGSYSIHISEFPSAPLHSILMRNVSIRHQKSGSAGILISGGWIRNIGLHNLVFEDNSAPSLIVVIECNDDNEKLIRIEDSKFQKNRDIVQHVQLGSCASFQLENNTFLENNDDGFGNTLVITTENGYRKMSGVMELRRNKFINNSGIYTITVDSHLHDVFITDNQLINNQNSAAVLRIIGDNTQILTNDFNNNQTKFQLSYNEKTPIDVSSNQWHGKELQGGFDSSPDSVYYHKNDEQLDPLNPITMATEINSQCAHLKFCSQKGVCKDGICICNSGFTGFDCDIPTECNCSGNGLCDLFNKCLCHDGWTGLKCSTPICPKSCSSHGKCVGPNQCNCNPGWIGPTCSITTCIDSKCIHGHCSNGVCKCEKGWKGSRCQIPVCSNCSLNGYCRQPDECDCFMDFHGSSCTIFENNCDFDCDHGKCDELTTTCQCSQGWKGGACDVCNSSTLCLTNSIVTFIQPSTAELEDTNVVVNVFGEDFPKTINNNSYICTFGSTSTTGRRIKSSLIRCPMPSNMTLGRHVFSIALPQSFNNIPTLSNHPIHFTLFDGCDPSICQGSCIGPLCICPQGKTGVWCDVIEILPTIDRRFLEHQRANRGIEGVPYVVMLPTLASSVLRVNSTIPNDLLNFHASKGIISWAEPMGSETPYEISVTAFSPAGETRIEWNVTIDPEYDVELRNVVVQNRTAKIMAKIIGKNSNERPILIRIRRKSDGILDEIQAKSNEQGLIEYDYIPQLPGSYEVSVQHPGVMKPSKIEQFNIAEINIPIDGDSTLTELRLKIGETAQKCEANILEPKYSKNPIKSDNNRLIIKFDQQWSDEIVATVNCTNTTTEIIRVPPVQQSFVNVEPKELAIYQINSNNQFYELQIFTNSIQLVDPLNIRISTDTLKLISTNPELNNLNEYNNGKSDIILYFIINNKNGKNGTIEIMEKEKIHQTIPFTFFGDKLDYHRFKICARDEWDGQDELSTDLATISISNNQQNGVAISRPDIRLNIQWAEFTVPSGIYNLQIESEMHDNVHQIIELTPTNATFCVKLSSTKSQSLPAIHCAASTNDCHVEIGSMTRKDARLPYLKFEPSVVTNSNQKILATCRGSTNGLIGLWNTKIDGFDIVSSRRTISINESFWITISWEATPSSSSTNLHSINIPFIFIPDKSMIPIHTSSMILIKPNSNQIQIDESNDDRVQFASTTSIMCNCGDGARKKCRQMYRSATACGRVWDKIADDTISIEVLASFLSMIFECNEVSVQLSTIRQSLKCVASIENDCPLTRKSKREIQIEKYQNDSPLSIVNHLSSMNSDLGRVLPILNALDVQTIRISSLFIDFIDRLDGIFPSSLFNDLNRDTIDVFLESISDFSSGGQLITRDEHEKMRGRGDELVELWNETVKAWRAGDMEAKGVSHENARLLIMAADRIKSLARQNLAEDPFMMLHGYMERTLETGEAEQKICASSTVFIDETDVTEDGQLKIRVFIENKISSILKDIEVTLSFQKSHNSTADVNFNNGPLWASGIGSINGHGSLEINGSFEIQWTRIISSTYRLTSIAYYQPIIIFSFTSNQRRTQQKLLAPQIRVSPRKTIKAMKIIKDEQSPTEGIVDFSIIISIINPGYSMLKNVEVRLNEFQFLNSTQMPNLDSIFINGKRAPNTFLIKFNEIQSGSTQLIRIIMKNQKGEIIPIISANVSCIENQQLLRVENSEMYSIRAIGPTDFGMLLSLPHQANPLFYFRPSLAQLVNVIQLQYLSMKLVNTSGLIYEAAFRNHQSKSFAGALWAKMPSPDIENGFKLTKIIDALSPRQRELQAVQWESDENGKSMLNWIDSGDVIQQQDYRYQLIFENSEEDHEEELNSPHFEFVQYRFQISDDSDSIDSNIPIGQVTANGDDLTYSLYNPDNSDYFTIDPETGHIYFALNSDIFLPKDEYCVIVEAKDSKGNSAKVPVAINNGGKRRDCSIFNTDGIVPGIHFPSVIPTSHIFTTESFDTTTTSTSLSSITTTSIDATDFEVTTEEGKRESESTTESEYIQTYSDSTLEAVTSMMTTTNSEEYSPIGWLITTNFPFSTSTQKSIEEATTPTGNSEEATISTGNSEETTVSTGNSEEATTPTGNSEEATISTGNSEETTVSTGNSEEATTPTGNSEETTTPAGNSEETTTPTGNSEDATTPAGNSEETTTPTGNSEETTTPTGNSEEATTSSSNNDFSIIPTLETFPDADLTTSETSEIFSESTIKYTEGSDELTSTMQSGTEEEFSVKTTTPDVLVESSTTEEAHILPTDPITEPSTEETYLISSDSTLDPYQFSTEQISTTNQIETTMTTNHMPTLTDNPLNLIPTTRSYEQNEQFACSHGSSIYKIICDVSKVAQPIK